MMKKVLFASALFVVPSFAFAQDGTSLQGLFVLLRNLINLAIPLLIALTVLIFLYGIFRFILDQTRGDTEKAKTDKKIMLWGIVGLFVMVSVWGLVNILVNSLGLDNIAPGDQIDQLTEGIPFATNCPFDYQYYDVPTGLCVDVCADGRVRDADQRVCR